MPTIEPIELEAAGEKSRELLDTTERRIGRSSNMLRTMAYSPAVLEAYLQFNRAFEHTRMSPRLRGLLTVAIAQALGCEYILSVGFALGQREGLSRNELEAARRGESNDDKIARALRFALHAVERRGDVAPEMVAALHEAGYSDEERVEIIGAIALNLFRNYFNLIVRPEVDFPQVPVSYPLTTLNA